MTGLVLKLKPNEKFLINGVVLQNCDRAARIRVRTNDVSILLSRDAIRPEDANTPLKRIYYLAQLSAAGEVDPGEASTQIRNDLKQLETIFSGTALVEIDRAHNGAKDRKFYVVMRVLRKLFPLEKALLERSAGP